MPLAASRRTGYRGNVTIRPRLALFARYPTPGRAKTRLIPALGAQGAADQHRRLTERTLATLHATGLSVEVRSTGAPADSFRRWLGDVVVIPQGGGLLGARMARAARESPAILIGADIPDLTTELVQTAATLLQRHSVVIGPALDGGYYLIGVREPAPWLFAPMAWGSDTVLTETLERCAARGIVPGLLTPLADLDRPEDIARWPGL